MTNSNKNDIQIAMNKIMTYIQHAIVVLFVEPYYAAVGFNLDFVYIELKPTREAYPMCKWEDACDYILWLCHLCNTKEKAFDFGCMFCVDAKKCPDIYEALLAYKSPIDL